MTPNQQGPLRGSPDTFCQRKSLCSFFGAWFVLKTLPIYEYNQFLLEAVPFTDILYYISLLLGQFLLVGCICANVVIRVIYVRILYPTRYYYYLCMYAGQSSESARIVQNMLVERLTLKFLVFKVNWNYKLIQIFERQKWKIDPATASYIK